MHVRVCQNSTTSEMTCKKRYVHPHHLLRQLSQAEHKNEERENTTI